jgi:SAM-dependent methyltransferase
MDDQHETGQSPSSASPEAPDGLPFPPPELHFLVSGNPELDHNAFWEIGRGCATLVTTLLNNHGVRIEDCEAILDFGCGCGRTIRHFGALETARLFGTDYNPQLVEWCRNSFPFAEFAVNRIKPPLAYADAKFDVIYALSVFTHLPRALQLPWLDELWRVLKPGGHLVMTTHGAAHARRFLPPRQHAKFQSGHLVVVSEDVPGTNACLAYHPVEFVKRSMTKGWIVLEAWATDAQDADSDVMAQDSYLLRRPLHAPPRPSSRGSLLRFVDRLAFPVGRRRD